MENCCLVGENECEKGGESWALAIVSLMKFICVIIE